MMRKQNAIWIAGAIVFGALLIAGVSLIKVNPAPPRQPAYSLSPGNMGMLISNNYDHISLEGEAVSTEVLLDEIQAYLDRQGNPDLAVARLREFRLAYQAEVIERSTGRHAFGLMVGKATAQISPKAGPNLFWNTKYGAMIAEIGGGYGMLGHLLPQTPLGEMPLAENEARGVAERALQELGGLELDDETNLFYGFYEFIAMQDNEPVGELDVNGYSGQVWFEEWRLPQLSVENLEPE